MNDCTIRPARPSDQPGAYHVCLKTGNFGKDGEPFYREDPDALGRIFVGPYLAYEPELSLMLEDSDGICGYALGAFDSRAFYARYESGMAKGSVRTFSRAAGRPRPVEPRADRLFLVPSPRLHHARAVQNYPAHLHIDLLPRARGRGFGRRMMEQVMNALGRRGCPGAHLGVSMMNTPAFGFYRRLGFSDLLRVGEGNDGCIYMGKNLRV